MQAPRKPWERQQPQQAVPGGGIPGSYGAGDVGSGIGSGGLLDKEFPPVAEQAQEVDSSNEI